jgi:hypothetical protein
MWKASFKESNLVEVIYDVFSFYIMLLMFLFTDDAAHCCKLYSIYVNTVIQ